MSEIPSSGGLLIATSLERSPVVLLAFAALEVAAVPKNDMVGIEKPERRAIGRPLMALY